MALMAPTQASPAPHPNDFHPDFPNLRNLHCSGALRNHSLTEKHLLPPQRSSDDSTGDPPAFFC